MPKTDGKSLPGGIREAETLSIPILSHPVEPTAVRAAYETRMEDFRRLLHKGDCCQVINRPASPH